MSEIFVYKREDYAKNLCKLIENEAEKTLKTNEKFTVGFSGGSLVNYLCDELPNIKTDWSKWLIFFCDERIVPENSDDSISGAYKKKLLSNVPLTNEQFVTIKYGVPPEQAAVDYREKISKYFTDGLPVFSLLLLGMGPDGHTCSLFPNHPLLDEENITVAAIFDSPKPPPERITLTLPVINNAKTCMFAVTGADKAETLKGIRTNKVDLPVTRVKPNNGKLVWVVDEAAAKLL